jgi:hypothetical protein
VTPGKAAEYAINWLGRAPAGMDVAQIASEDQQWHGFLAAIEGPALSAGSVAEEIMDAGQAFARLSEPARALYQG